MGLSVQIPIVRQAAAQLAGPYRLLSPNGTEGFILHRVAPSSMSPTRAITTYHPQAWTRIEGEPLQWHLATFVRGRPGAEGLSRHVSQPRPTPGAQSVWCWLQRRG
jgi:hypothetical protein